MAREVATVAQRERAGPREVALTLVTKSSPPQPQQSTPEDGQAIWVSWYRVVVEVSVHDRFEPSLGFGHGIVHAPLQKVEAKLVVPRRRSR